MENAEGQTFKRICDEFMAKNPDVEIDYKLVYDEAYHTEVASRIDAGNIPDIAYMGADERWGGAWKDSGQQVDNTPYYPSYIDMSLVPDFYGTGVRPYLPLGGSNYCSVVGINTRLLAEVDPTGKIPETYNDLKSLAQKVVQYNDSHNTEIKVLSTHGADAWVWGSCVLSGIIPRTTGDAKWIEKAVNGSKNFTDNDFVAALNVVKQWVADGILDPDSATTNDGAGKENFADGKYVMYIDGQWGFSEAIFGELSSDIKLITIPAVLGEATNSVTRSLASAWQVGYGITKKGTQDAKVLDAAKRWLAYFNSAEEALNRLRDGGISSTIIKNFQYPDDIDPLVKEKAKLGAYPSCYVIDSYLSGNANDALNAGVQDIVLGTKTVAQVAENIQAALQNKTPKEVTTEVSFWHIDVDDYQQAAWQKIINNFEAEHPNVKIKVTVYDNDHFHDELQEAIDAGNIPDVFRSWGGASVRELASQGKLRAITNNITSGSISQIGDGGKALFRYNNNVYGLPYSMGIFGLWYNTSVFNNLNLTASDFDTWSEFCEHLEGIKPISLGAHADWTSQYWWSYLAQRLGGEQAYLDAVNGTNGAAFNTGVFLTAMEMYKDFVDDHPFQNGFLDDYDSNQLALIADGYATFTLMGSWAPSVGRANATTEAGETSEWGFLPFPTVGNRTGQSSECLGSCDGLAIGKDAPDAAVEFLKSLYEPKNYAIICGELWACPVIDGYDDYMDDAVVDMAEIARNATVIQNVYDCDLPGSVTEAMKTALNRILSDSTYTAQQACDAIQAAMVEYRNGNN